MRYVLNGPLKEYRNKRRTDKTRTKLTETALVTPASTFTRISQSIKTRCNRTYISFEAIVLKLMFRYYNTLAAGLHKVTQQEMGVILRVIDGEILIFSFDVVL